MVVRHVVGSAARAAVGVAMALYAAGCLSTGDTRPMTPDTLGDASTGDDGPSLTIGSLVTGLDDATSADPDDDSGTTASPGASSGGTTGPNDADSGSGSGSGSDSTGDLPPLPAYCGDTIPTAGAEPLIDDLELEAGQMLPDDEIPNHDGRVGFWFTYNDGTVDGEQTPSPGSFQPAVGGAADTAYSAGTFGAGFVSWGAGMGVKLNNDFSGDCPYDASSYDGITFHARGNVPVRLSITTRATHPIDQGGTCDPGLGQCSDHFGINLALGPDWQEHTVEWAELIQQGWGIPAEFDPGQIIEIQWQAPVAQAFDVQVDELRLWAP